MSEEQEPITLQLGSETRKFKDVSDLGTWVKKEAEVWRGFASAAQPNRTLVEGRQKQRSHVSTFVGHIDHIERASNDRDKDRFLETLKKSLETASSASKDRFIPSDSPQGNHVLTLAEDDPDIAAAALTYFADAEIPSGALSAVAISGLFEAVLFDKGYASNVDAERDSLSKLRESWEAKFVEDDAHNANTLRDVEELKQNIQAAQAKQDAEFQRIKEKGEQRIEELEHLFFKKIQTDASRSYWNKRAWLARGSFAFWLAILAAGAGSFVYLFLGFVDSVTKSGVTGEAALLQYGSLLLLAVIGVGGLRLVAKLLLGSLHVSQEASERVTMIQTYLALLREDSAVEDEERSLILPTLFRPGSSGLTREEPRSELPIETVLSLLSKRSQ